MAVTLLDLAEILNPDRLARLEALHADTITDRTGLDQLVQLVQQLLGAGAAYLSLVDAEQQHIISQIGLSEALPADYVLPVSDGLCAYVVASSQPVVAVDTRQDPRFADRPFVHQFGIGAYVGIPVTVGDGQVVGALCAIDSAPRAWTDDEVALVSALATQARSHLESHAAQQRADQAEQDRLFAESFLEQVFQATPDVIYVYDLHERRNIYSNRELSRALGYSENEVRESEPDAIADLLHPDDLATLRMRNERMRGAPLGTVMEDEYRMRHADGTYRWLHSRETILEQDSEGNPWRLLGVAQDVTRRRQMEAAQRETVHRLTLMRRVDIELLRTLDLQGALTVAMDAALRVTNASDAFIGLMEGDQVRIISVAGGYEREALLPLNEGVLGRAMRSSRPELIQDVTADPEYVAYLPGTRAQMVLPLVYRERAVGVMVLDSRRADRLTPDTFEFMKLIIDRITVSIENALLYQLAQDRLTQVTALYDRVRQLEQLKTDMIRLAAHDLRSPLNVAMIHADLILEDPALDAERRHGIEEIRLAASRMDRIVSDILSLQRIEAMDTSERDPVSLSRLVETVAGSRAEEAANKHITFSVLLPGSSVVVEADQALLREAIDNLIGNALKYTPAGGTVTVRLVERGGQALFEVEDTGPGVPDELQPRLFTPFFRARTAETAAVEGTGLGLHLVKNIVERHNGRMRFQSTYGRGSLFGFEIPSVRTGVLKPVG